MPAFVTNVVRLSGIFKQYLYDNWGGHGYMYINVGNKFSIFSLHILLI